MNDLKPPGPTVLSVVSGKGGVGKSIVAVNLAVTWARAGFRVVLVDADVGQGSCAYLLGATASVHLMVPENAGDQPEDALAELDARIAGLDRHTDFVILDAPAGIGDGVRWSMDRADASLVVLVDEPTAAADAYSLCKLVWERDPAYPLAAVVNMADSEAEATDVASRFSSLTGHFLDRKILYAGWVPFSGDMRRSVRAQRPVVETSLRLSSAFTDLADRVRCGVFETLAPMEMN